MRLPEKSLEWQAGAWKFGMRIRNVPHLLTTNPPGSNPLLRPTSRKSAPFISQVIDLDQC